MPPFAVSLERMAFDRSHFCASVRWLEPSVARLRRVPPAEVFLDERKGGGVIYGLILRAEINTDAACFNVVFLGKPKG